MKIVALFLAFLVVELSRGELRKANAVEYSCCYYNGKRIDCNLETMNNSLVIEWSDGLIESYSLVSQRNLGFKTYKDTRGGIWEWILHAQGNISLTNPINGNTISTKLRDCF